MPLWTPGSRDSFNVDNWGANPSATPGTSVIPGASDAEGNWTQLLAALAQDVFGFWLRVSDGATATAQKRHVVDIGVDPAGGSAYTAILNNLVAGSAATITTTGSGHSFFFPYYIKAGSSVAARIQGSNATAGTVRVGIKCYGQPSAPWLWPKGQYSETLGVTGSNGTSFTPGNAADGAWASLGTTAREMWWWQLGYQINNGTITAEYTYIDLAYGDASNKFLILRRMHGGTTGETCGTVLDASLLWFEAYCRVPAGSTLYVRGRCNNAPDTGYEACAVGIGG